MVLNTRRPSRTTLYIDIENLGLDEVTARNIIAYSLANWPRDIPRVTSVRAYTPPGSDSRWGVMLNAIIEKQNERDVWPFGREMPGLHIIGLQRNSLGAKEIADIIICADACADFVLQRTEFIAVLSNDSDFFVLERLIQTWQKELSISAEDGAPFVMFTHPGGAGISRLIEILPEKYVRKLSDDAGKPLVVPPNDEQVAAIMVNETDHSLGRAATYYQELIQSDPVLAKYPALAEHPATAMDAKEFETFLVDSIEPQWQRWGVNIMPTPSGTFYQVTDAARQRTFEVFPEAPPAPDPVPPAPESIPTPHQPQTTDRLQLADIIAEIYQESAYATQEPVIALIKEKHSGYYDAMVENGHNDDQIYRNEVIPMLRLANSVVEWCQTQQSFTASEVLDRIKRDHRAHWLAQIEQQEWAARYWPSMFVRGILRKENAVDVQPRGYQLPLPEQSSQIEQGILLTVANYLRGDPWRRASDCRDRIAAEHPEAPIVIWWKTPRQLQSQQERFSRYWASRVLNVLQTSFDLKRPDNPDERNFSQYRIFPESDEEFAKELVRLFPVDVRSTAEDALAVARKYGYPQSRQTPFADYMVREIRGHLEAMTVQIAWQGVLNRSMTFTVTETAKSRVHGGQH